MRCDGTQPFGLTSTLRGRHARSSQPAGQSAWKMSLLIQKAIYVRDYFGRFRQGVFVSWSKRRIRVRNASSFTFEDTFVKIASPS